jgi:hypothetical protein
VKIQPAPDEWDRVFNVDFFIQVKDKYIGIQIKSVSGLALDHYQWEEMHEKNHARFEKKYGGRVFFVYSRKSGNKGRIDNPDVIEDIRKEIERLQNE